jgi:hypothetical protein
MEPIKIEADGNISQVEITSMGGNGIPLKAEGTYPSHIACHLFNDKEGQAPARIIQDGWDGAQCEAFVADITDATVIGFKNFDFKEVIGITINTRGYASGHFEVMTAWDGEVLAEIPVGLHNVWTKASVDVNLPNGVAPLYFKYVGDGPLHFGEFSFTTK